MGRPSADDAAHLEVRLLDAAAELFMLEGYAKTTMERVSRAAGASTKTVYARYANKSELLAAVIQRLVDRTLNSELFDLGPAENTADARTQLYELALRLARLASAPVTAGINRLVIAEGVRFPELIEVYRGGPERARAAVRSTLAQLREEGKLRPSPASVDVAATVFFDMTTSTPRMRALLGAPLEPAAMEAHVGAAVDMFLEGNLIAKA